MLAWGWDGVGVGVGGSGGVGRALLPRTNVKTYDRSRLQHNCWNPHRAIRRWQSIVGLYVRDW
jgi:hypothetical protein